MTPMRRAVWLGALVLVLAVLRSDAAGAIGSPGNLRIAFAGDTHGFGIVDNPALANADLLGGARNVLGKADLFIFNHEGTLIATEQRSGNCRSFDNQSTFATPPDFATRLDPGMPAVASLANNHAMDCGEAGLDQTLLAFAGAGIPTVGAGHDLTDACRPLELTIKGTGIAIFSYLYEDPALLPEGIAATETEAGVATLGGCDVEASIKSLAPSDLVIVMLHSHWGSSWRYGLAAEHIAAVQDLMSWGADLVVSSGPHYPQGVLVQQRNMAFMGMGDFMFNPGYTLTRDGRKSFLGLAEIERARVARVWLYPFYVSDDGLPVPATPPIANGMLDVVSMLSDALQTTLTRLSGMTLVRPRPLSP